MAIHHVSSDRLTVSVDSLGAQLRSLQVDGTEYLWDAGAAWSWSAPVLFPIISGLPNDELVHDGARYPIPSHGFARRSQFEHLGDARFALSASDATREQYPFEFRLELDFTVADTTLTVTHTVSNEGDEPLPFTLGGHPALRWPLPGASGDHTVSWGAGGATMRQAVKGLRPGRIPSGAVGTSVTLDRSQFAEDAMLFDDLSPKAVSYTAPGAATVTLRYDDFAVLGIWSKPVEGDFVCLEPWTGYPAPQGFDGDVTELPDATLLAAGEHRRYSYSITVEGD